MKILIVLEIFSGIENRAKKKTSQTTLVIDTKFKYQKNNFYNFNIRGCIFFNNFIFSLYQLRSFDHLF